MDSKLDGPLSSSTQIAIVQASWHSDLVDRCQQGFLARLADTPLAGAEVSVHRVPGAFEIPLLASRLAKTARVHAIVAMGLVVDGGIYRHDFVANAVISGLMRVQLDCDTPIFSAVLTPLQFHEHKVHADFFHDHLFKKGGEAADACAAGLLALRAISGSGTT